jgi:O-antigen ligase
MVSDKVYITKMKRNRLGSVVDPYHFSNIDRINMAKTGIEIFKKHPLLGIGDIDITHIFAVSKKPYQKENFGHFHNNYVHILVILGVIGFLITMALLIKIMLVHIKIYKAVRSISFVSSFSMGALSSFIAFLVSGLAEWNFGDQEIITMIWFILGLNLAFYNYCGLLKKRSTITGDQVI